MTALPGCLQNFTAAYIDVQKPNDICMQMICVISMILPFLKTLEDTGVPCKLYLYNYVENSVFYVENPQTVGYEARCKVYLQTKPDILDGIRYQKTAFQSNPLAMSLTLLHTAPYVLNVVKVDLLNKAMVAARSEETRVLQSLSQYTFSIPSVVLYYNFESSLQLQILHEKWLA